MTILSVPETIAASLCWLSRWNLARAIGPHRAVEQVEGYWHRGTCRFCPRPLEELMADVNATINSERFAEQERLFKRLPGPARAARVREAQERPWYDDVLAGVDADPAATAD